MKPILFVTACAAACLAATAAMATALATPAGDWHGALTGQNGQVRQAVHITQTGPGVFAGDIDLPDTGIWDHPLEEITFRDGLLTFAYRGETRRPQPLGKVSAPVLAVVGEKDTQVPPAQNLPALRAALKTNGDATVLELPGLNHMLQTAKTGAVAEYYYIEETIAPSALDTLTAWLLGATSSDVKAMPCPCGYGWLLGRSRV